MSRILAHPFITAAVALGAAAAACSGTRGTGDPATAVAEAPATDAGTTDVAPAPTAATSVRPPDCRKLGETTSPVVNGLDATLLVFRCAPGDGPAILLNVRLTNRTAGPLRIDTRALPFPMLVFAVRDAQGNPVHGGPPPVPPVDDPLRWRVELVPNADYSFDAALDGVIAVDLAPGEYDIRFAYAAAPNPDGSWSGRVETGWIRFTLAAGER
jgi:hypothetical protein